MSKVGRLDWWMDAETMKKDNEQIFTALLVGGVLSLRSHLSELYLSIVL